MQCNIVKQSFILPLPIRKLRDPIYRIKPTNIITDKKHRESGKPYFNILDFIMAIPILDKNPMTTVPLLSEIYIDMSSFQADKNLVSRADCRPRNDDGAKKIKSIRISKSESYLKPLLVQISNDMIKSDKHPELKSRYHRIKACKGNKKAIVAIRCIFLTGYLECTFNA